MAFLDQNPPTFDNQLEYDKWVADQLRAAEADQDRQDDEIEAIKEELHGAGESPGEIGGRLQAAVHFWTLGTLSDCPEKTAYFADAGHLTLVLNHDVIPSGRVDWETELAPYPSTISLDFADGQKYWLTVEHTGNAGPDGRGKNFAIVDAGTLPFDRSGLDGIEFDIYKGYDPGSDGISEELEEKFVQKAGDHLSGKLQWNHESGEPNEHNYVGIRIRENSKRGKKDILLAESGGSFEDGLLTTELEPTKDESITNKKYVDGLDAKLWEDQDRQDQELEDYKQEVQADQDRQDKALQDEIDARVERDALHDAEIDTLEYKLDALLGLTFRGTYTFKHEADCDAEYEQCYADCWAMDPNDEPCRRNCGDNLKSCQADKVRPGFFEAVDPDDQFDHLEQIVISKNDASGVEVDWAGVLDAGDYLEVDHVFAGSLDKTNYGLYRIEEEPEVSTNSHGEVYTMKLQFLQGDGVMLEDEKYEIRGITAAEGVNPEELGDFLTKDDAAKTYLPLTGGTLTGTLNMKDNAAVKTRHLDSGQNSNLQIKHNGVSKVYVGEDETAFKNDIKLSSNDIGGVGNISINTDGCIKHNDNERLKFQSKSTSNPGDGLVVFERPDSHGRRGITVRGLHPDDNKETDILWSYTNASNGDAVNYDGKMSADTNLVNRGWIDANKAAKNHSHSNYASSSHNHDSKYVKGNYTITKSGNLYLIS